MTSAELLAVIRFYISSCSTPLQGPISGAMNFVRPSDVQRALDELENAVRAIHSRALDETLSHEERLLAIERLTRMEPLASGDHLGP